MHLPCTAEEEQFPTVRTDCKLLGLIERGAAGCSEPAHVGEERAGTVLPLLHIFRLSSKMFAIRFGVMFLLMPQGWLPTVGMCIIPQILESGHWTIVVPMLFLDMHWNNEVDRHIFVGYFSHYFYISY